MAESEKHHSLLHYGINYDRNFFNDISPWSQSYKDTTESKEYYKLSCLKPHSSKYSLAYNAIPLVTA